MTRIPDTSSVNTVQALPESASVPIDSASIGENIHKDLFSMFEVDIATASPDTLNKLRDISSWAMDDQTFVGDGLMKVREMIDKIPSTHKNKHESVWNLLSLQRRIEKNREEAVDLQKRKIAIYNDKPFSGGRPYYL